MGNLVRIPFVAIWDAKVRMNVSDIVNWGTIGIWLVGFVLWIGRLLRGEVTMHPWLEKLLSSNGLLGVVIFAGLLSTGGMVYQNYRENHLGKLEDVTVTAYPPPGTSQTMQVISGQTFENESLPLDGHVYDHCTFVNVCLLYDGGAYQLQHVTFKDHWKVCVKEPSLKNYDELEKAMHFIKPGVKSMQKSVLAQH